MISGIVASQARGAPVAVQKLIFPLTYDEQDSDNAITLTRAGSGPHITPAGFEGDGYSSRYTYASVPGWVSSSSRLTLACAVTAPLAPLQSARDELVSVCENNTNARQLLGLSVVADPRSAPEGAIAVRAWNGTQLEQVIGRPGWRYEFRSPVLSAGGYTAKPQGVLFLDSDTIIFSVHLDDTESRVYKMRLSDGVLLGEFTFGTSTYRHIATFARRSNGDVWASDYDTNKLLRLDLDASFSSGSAVILDVYDTTALAPYVGSIEFVTVSGTEYLLLALYNTTETGIHTYVINASLLGTATFTLGDQFKRFDIGRRIQGIAMRSGKMIVARNALYGVSGAVNGYIQEVDIVTAITSLATNSTINATTNSSYLTGQWFGPSSYVEDVAIHPVNNDLFIPTEGAYAVADYDGYLALWSSSLAELGVENRYAIEYDGNNQVKVKINNREWGNMAWSPTATPAVLTIGGLPTASAGNAAGFCWSTIANVLIQDRALSNAGYEDLFSGSYEASALTTYVVSLTNPGGESNTTGWTSEVGGLSTKSPTGPTAAVQPLPHSGVGYFFGGANAQTIARQRATLTTVTGLSTGDLDTAIANGMWGRIRWWQSSYDNTGGTSTDEDTASMGIRYLNGSATQLSLTYSGLLRMNPRLTWFRRSLPISVPSTARSIDAVYRSDRANGTNNDGYVDDITLHLYAK